MCVCMYVLYYIMVVYVSREIYAQHGWLYGHKVKYYSIAHFHSWDGPYVHCSNLVNCR